MAEVPLLRESSIFVSRLCDAAGLFDDSKFQFARRVNWSHKYSDRYYQDECTLFLQAPDKYLCGAAEHRTQLEDVFRKRIGRSATLRVLVKALLHRGFGWIGAVQRFTWRTGLTKIYRKAYVDDIELVFDDTELSDRFVYPFPISIKRQFRYLLWLIRTNRRFCLAGHDYSLKDLANFIRVRNIDALLRLESRAQLRHARRMLSLGYRKFELSDEFDLGSLEFCRFLSRGSVTIENGAHGIGKYLPFHKYQIFRTVTERQIAYYRAVGPCHYEKTVLKINRPDPDKHIQNQHCSVIFVSQIFDGISPLVQEAEAELLPTLVKVVGTIGLARLFYRPHPNETKIKAPDGFIRSSMFEDYGPVRTRIFLSLFSTTHIDPNFQGDSYLIQTQYIRPDIGFDEDGKILTVSELTERLGQIIASKLAT